MIKVLQELIQDYKQEIETYKIMLKTDMYMINKLINENTELESKLIELRIQLKDSKTRKKHLHL